MIEGLRDLLRKARGYFTTDIEVLIASPGDLTFVEDNALGGALTIASTAIDGTTRGKLVFHHGAGSYVTRRDREGSVMEIRRVGTEGLRVTVTPPGGDPRSCIERECRLGIGSTVTVPDSRGLPMTVRRIRHRDLRPFRFE